MIFKLFGENEHPFDIKLMRMLPLDEFDYLELNQLNEELSMITDKKLLQKFVFPKNSKNRKILLTRT
jgi:hypothetical protein